MADLEGRDNFAGNGIEHVDPNITSDLATFDKEFGLPAPPSFKVVSQSGGSTSGKGTRGARGVGGGAGSTGGGGSESTGNIGDVSTEAGRIVSIGIIGEGSNGSIGAVATADGIEMAGPSRSSTDCIRVSSSGSSSG